jgi:hypothetical protein
MREKLQKRKKPEKSGRLNTEAGAVEKLVEVRKKKEKERRRKDCKKGQK